MIPLNYSRNTKVVAQTMRREMTPAEKHLWYDLLKHYPVTFHRQKQFGRFIADFYCAAVKLVIEVDGHQHETEQGAAYDHERTDYLNSLGIRVLRLTNDDVMHCFEQVCICVDKVVSEWPEG